MKVLAVRRYPVKSMGGEPLERADVDGRGIVGDRWHAVTDGARRLACGKDSRRFRRRDGVFDWSARTTGSAVLVRGPAGEWPVGDDVLDAALSESLGDPVRVLAETDIHHQDGGQVSLVGTASLDWCREHLEVDADPRRLRVNLVVETETPFEEESWVGSSLVVGSTRLSLVERIERCRTIDLAQDGVATTARWLRGLGASREVCLGVYADVASPGVIAVGDEVRVEPALATGP